MSLASATQYDLAAVLDQQPVRVRGISSVLSECADCDGSIPFPPRSRRRLRAVRNHKEAIA
jgi:hypothetical protein